MMSRLLPAVKYTLLGAVLLTGTWNCRKDVDEFRPYVYSPSQSSIAQLVGQVSPATSVHTFALKALNHDTTLTTSSGMRIGLTDTEELFADANNQVVAASSCQNLQIQVTEVLDRSDLLGRDIHTAIYPGGQLLESGGIAYIQATCDGSPLKLLPARNLKVQIPATVLKNDMLAYNGVVQNSTTFQGWQASGDPAYLAEWISDSQQLHGYELYPEHLGWVGAGRPLPETTSGFCIKLPTGMTNETARVFLVFQGVATVAALTYDASSESFCFDQAPVGYPVQVVTISKLGDQYWLGKRETEVGTNNSFRVEPQKITEEALLEFLRNL